MVSGPSVSADAETTDRILKYRQSRDPALLQLLVEQYSYLVNQKTKRDRRSAEYEDLHQEGFLGLLSAIEKFDPTRGVCFPAYAQAVIAGRLRHYKRDKIPLIRYRSGNQRRLGREDMKPVVRMVGLTQSGTELYSPGWVAADSTDGYERAEEQSVLAQLFLCLTPQERSVLFLTVIVEAGYKEIGRRLGCTARHISRLKRQALDKLRAQAVPA